MNPAAPQSSSSAPSSTSSPNFLGLYLRSHSQKQAEQENPSILLGELSDNHNPT